MPIKFYSKNQKNRCHFFCGSIIFTPKWTVGTLLHLETRMPGIRPLLYSVQLGPWCWSPDFPCLYCRVSSIPFVAHPIWTVLNGLKDSRNVCVCVCVCVCLCALTSTDLSVDVLALTVITLTVFAMNPTVPRWVASTLSTQALTYKKRDVFSHPIMFHSRVAFFLKKLLSWNNFFLFSLGFWGLILIPTVDVCNDWL